MSIKEETKKPIVIDGIQYNFDGDIRIKIKQFYKLDLLERTKIIKLAEMCEEKFKETEQSNKTFTEKFKKLNDTINIKENGDVDFTISGNLLLNGQNIKNESTGDVTSAGNNVFTGTNTFNNINLKGQISFSNNPIFAFKYMNVGSGMQSVFHLGNTNFPLNLLAKDDKVMINGKAIGNNKSTEVIYDGILKVPVPSEGLNGDTGAVIDYSYAHLVNGKEYSFIYFLIEDDINDTFNFMINYSNSRYCLNLIVPAGVKSISKNVASNCNFLVQIDDKQKKISFAFNYKFADYLCIKKIVIF